MKTITFQIKGNHQSGSSNPLPKLKMTGKQSWTKKAREYVAWKDHVIRSFIDSMTDETEKRNAILNVSRYGKPIVIQKTDHAIMVLKITWSNKAHGDPENVFGSIADALFKNDKNLDPWVVSAMSDTLIRGKPAAVVYCKIHFFESEEEKVKFSKKIID